MANDHCCVTAVAGAAWVGWVFAAMFAVLTLFYGLRLGTGSPPARGSARGVDVSRAVMSLGMVAMLVPSLDPLPRLVWQLLFVVAAVHIAIRLLRRRRSAPDLPDPRSERGGHHELHLVIGALSMLFMFAVIPAGHEMAPGMSMQPSSTGLVMSLLTWAFVGYFLVFAVRLGARLAVPVVGAIASPARSLVVSPQLLGSSEVVMGIGMSYMLVTML